MKICYLTHDINEKTGTGIFSTNIVTAINKLRPRWQTDFVVAETDVPRVAAHVIPMRRKDIWRQFFNLRKFVKNYDLVHALDGFPYGVLAIFSTLGTRKKIFITAIGSGAIFMPKRPLRNMLLRFSYNYADQVFTASSHIARRIKEEMPDLDIQVINHGIGQHLNNDENQDLNLPTPYILTVGYLKKRKGYEYSIRAFAKCLEINPEVNYVIVGNTLSQAYKDKVLKLIDDLGLKHKVFFYENLSPNELAQVYSGAELFVLMPQETPYALEGFGMVYLEAAQFGLPVVGSKDSSAEDAVLDNRNGFLVPAQDVEAIAEAVSRILDNKDLALQMRKESKKFAARMTWEKAASEYIEFYEKLRVGSYTKLYT